MYDRRIHQVTLPPHLSFPKIPVTIFATGITENPHILTERHLLFVACIFSKMSGIKTLLLGTELVQIT